MRTIISTNHISCLSCVILFILFKLFCILFGLLILLCSVFGILNMLYRMPMYACYNAARNTVKVAQICRGFEATGIHPFNPSRAKLSSQVTQIDQPAPQSLPQSITPPGIRRSSQILKTPTRGQDVIRCLRNLTPAALPIVRNKVAKAVAFKDITIATQSREIDSLKRQLEVYTGASKRTRVHYDIQQQFASIESIKDAQDKQRASEVAAASRAQKYQHQNDFYTNDAETKAEHDQALLSMQFEFEFDSI